MTNLKQIESRYVDGKSCGVRADLKKKMKKSRSSKLSNVESLRSSSPLKMMNILHEVKPKQCITKATAMGSPHYMKSTTSFDARKEHNQMSPQTAKPASSNKSARQNSLLMPDSSSTRRTRSSTSLKLARALTKTPSFKHTSLSARKYSKGALCTGVKSQKATCSSTLKDLKFPSYLMLNPGGTDSEGISIIKVCPYTYCSLNGHFHTPLPPLRSFLSAKRRLLKASKIAKLEALPPRMNSTDEGRIETQAVVMVSNGKPARQDEDLDFFIEIYAKNNVEVAERNECAVNDDGYAQETFDSTKILQDFDEYMSSAGDVDGYMEVDIHEQRHEDDVLGFIGDKIGNADHQHKDETTNCTSTQADEVSKIDHQKNEFRRDEQRKKHSVDKVDSNIYESIANQVTADESFLLMILDEEITPIITASDVSTEQELQLHGIKINKEQTNPSNNLKRAIRSKRSVRERDEQRAFNPREPTYLPVKSDPEAEKIDLKHQPEDERKTAEEWMLDYALRQAVTKLAPARSRRVALLVEAFETVSPISKYEARVKHFSTVLTCGRPLQTCI